MTFDEWLDGPAFGLGLAGRFALESARLARLAFDAATLAEREACAKVCDNEHKRDDLTGGYRYGAGICAYEIRKRSNIGERDE